MASEPLYNLEDCEVEPIHIPGFIQPFGIVLATDANYTIQYVSSNVEDVINIPAYRLLGVSIQSVLGIAFEPIRRELDESVADDPIITEFVINGQQYHLTCNRQGDMILFDWDPVIDDYRPLKAQDFFIQVQRHVSQLQSATDIRTLCQLAADAIQALIGFDRVMVYRFDDVEGHGEVIAEANTGRLESYLGLHYPATDIPKQARDLFYLNGVRMIPNVDDTPVQLLAVSADLPPLDLSRSMMRGVSPGHIIYLQNMGVTASMSISITYGGNLWGLFACHHADPRYISRDVREMCSFLGMVFSAQISAIVKKEAAERDRQMLTRLNAITRQLREGDGLINTIRQLLPLLMDLIDAGGIALVDRAQIDHVGQTPTDDQIMQLVRWHQSMDHGPLFYTHTLGAINPAAQDYADVASGVMIMNLSSQRNSTLIWFRPGIERTITWGRQIPQDPNEPQLTPGNSFQQWRQLVRGRADRWDDNIIKIMSEFLSTIVDLQLKQLTLTHYAQFEQILSSLPAIIFIHWDDEILYVNPFTANFTGQPVSYWVNRPISALLPGIELSAKGRTQQEVQLTAGNGQQHWMYAQSMPIYFPPDQTQAPATLTQIFDITARKQAEETMFALELEQQRVRILTEFLQDVSHDLRTPLAVLQSSMYFIKRTAPESQQKRTQEMENQISYMTNMLDSMFTMVSLDRVDELSKEAVDLNALINILVERTQPTLLIKHITLVTDLNPELPAIPGHVFELERCLVNLVENAIKFSPDGSQITLVTRFDDTHAYIDISDEGIGIPADKLDDVFKRFYKADSARNKPGSGLGLSIVKKIIDLHGGEITVSSTVGTGTTFHVRLPRA